MDLRIDHRVPDRPLQRKSVYPELQGTGTPPDGGTQSVAISEPELNERAALADARLDHPTEMRRVADLDSGHVLEVTTVGDLTLLHRVDDPGTDTARHQAPRHLYGFAPRRARPPWARPDVLVLGDDLPNYLRAERRFVPLTPSGLNDLLQAPARPLGRGSAPPIVAVPDELMDTKDETTERLEPLGIPVVALRNVVQERCRLAFLDGDAPDLPQPRLWRRVANRMIDLLIGIIGFVVLVAVLPLIAVAVFLEDRGPIFYVQERIGLGGKPFPLIKFRSMRPDAEAAGPIWATLRDDRITKVGAVLRRYKIDELPQVLNVLLGHMAAVGPRPERVVFVDTLRQLVPHYDVRHSMRPGLTGWGTIKVGYGNSVEAKYLTHQYDIYHLENRTIRFNLEILARSLFAIMVRAESQNRFML